MKILLAMLLSISLISELATCARADAIADVWTTGVLEPSDGAFGTPGSVAFNTVNATITTGSTTANVSLSANTNGWFRTIGAPNITNDELAPFFENGATDSPTLTTLHFSSDTPLHNFDILFHNLWHNSQNEINYVGNFRVRYENDPVGVFNAATPVVRAINDDSPFATDQDLQPTGIDGVFNGSNLLSQTGPTFSPVSGSPASVYLFDASQSVTSESQGSGVVSFDESNGGVREIQFLFVGSSREATAFIGFAGSTVSAVPTPEPSTSIILGALGVFVCHRRVRVK